MEGQAAAEYGWPGPWFPVLVPVDNFTRPRRKTGKCDLEMSVPQRGARKGKISNSETRKRHFAALKLVVLELV